MIAALGSPSAAGAAYPVSPDDGAIVDVRDLVFSVGFDPGDLRAKVLVLDDGLGYELTDDAWQPGAAESPWLTPDRAAWARHVRPGFYAWRLCAVDDETDPDEECDLAPEIRFVTVIDGAWRPCRGTYHAGFINHISQRRASCMKAHRITRSWIRRSRLGLRPPPRRLRVGRYRCKFQLFVTEENPYGRTTCTASGGRRVRFYGTS